MTRARSKTTSKWKVNGPQMQKQKQIKKQTLMQMLLLRKQRMQNTAHFHEKCKTNQGKKNG